MLRRHWILWALCASSVAHAGYETVVIDAGRGDVTLLVPEDHRTGAPLPLFLSLHGFGGDGNAFVQYWNTSGQLDTQRFIVAAPDGSVDSRGKRFWNATDACCNKDGSSTDDSGYLRALVEAIEAKYPVDPLQIHAFGYSNGGFMAHRMACDHADKFASIVSVAGASFADASSCQPTHPVHILQVHGSDDPVIRYGGGSLKNYGSTEGIRHPSALQTVRLWVDAHQIDPVPEVGEMLDTTGDKTGPDTTVLRFGGSGDSPLTAVLWTIHGAGHVPAFSSGFSRHATAWMLSHSKAPPGP